MFNLVWIGYSFLLTLSFFTLIIWFVVNTAIKKNSFAFKLRTMSAVLTIGTIIVAILYAIDITFADIFAFRPNDSSARFKAEATLEK